VFKKAINIVLVISIVFGFNTFSLDGSGIRTAHAETYTETYTNRFLAATPATFIGTSGNLYWEVVNAPSYCQITNDRGLGDVNFVTNLNHSGYQTSPIINDSTVFTLNCTTNSSGEGKIQVGSTATVNATLPVPSFDGTFDINSTVVSTTDAKATSSWSVNNTNTDVSDGTKVYGGSYSTVTGTTKSQSGYSDSGNALKLTTSSTGYPVAYSAPFPVGDSASFTISFDYKAEGILANTPLTQFAAFNEYYGEKINPVTYNWLPSYVSPADAAKTGWQSSSVTAYGIDKDTVNFIRIKLSGPVGIVGGSITYDNIVITPNSIDKQAFAETLFAPANETFTGTKTRLSWFLALTRKTANLSTCVIKNDKNDTVSDEIVATSSRITTKESIEKLYGTWTPPFNITETTTFTMYCSSSNRSEDVLIGVPVPVRASGTVPSFADFAGFESGETLAVSNPSSGNNWSVDNSRPGYKLPDGSTAQDYIESSLKAKDGSFEVVSGKDSAKGLKLTTDDFGYPIAYSVPYPVKLGDAFKISFDYKYTGTRISEPLTQLVGFEEYYGEKVGSTAYPWLASRISLGDANDNGWHSSSATIYGIKSPDISYIRLKLAGPVGVEGGSITYDNIVVTPVSFEPTATKGCDSSTTSGLISKCVDLGNADATDDSSITSFPASTAAITNYISEKKTETEGSETISYKEIQNAKSVTVKIDAAGMYDTATGLPNKDLMLEVRYKDSFYGDLPGTNYYNYIASRTRSATLVARTDFGYTSGVPVTDGAKDSTYLDSLLAFGEYGNNKWRVAQAIIPKTKWQAIKAIDGTFQIHISMPTSSTSDSRILSLPLDYISLSEITPEAVAAYQQNQRDIRGLRKVDYKPTNTRPDFDGDFTWFTSPSSQQIFPNYYPSQSQIDNPAKSIKIQSAQAQIEPGNFSIITNNALTNVSIKASDLTSVSNTRTIPVANIDLYKTVYEYNYWSNPSSNADSYGLQPNRYEPFHATDTINIEADKTQQFYFTIKVPEDLPGGTYSGNITITVNGNETLVPVSIEVLGIKLSEPAYVPIQFYNPITDANQKMNWEYSEFIDNKFLDTALPEAIAAHGMQTSNVFPHFCSSLDKYICKKDDSGLPIFDQVQLETFGDRLQQSIDTGIVTKQAFYMGAEIVASEIVSTLELKGSQRENQTNTLFILSFNRWLDEIEEIAKEKNVTMVYMGTDESYLSQSKEMTAYNLANIIKDRDPKLKTWQTYSEENEKPMACTILSVCGTTVNGVLTANLAEISALASLIDYKVWTPGKLTVSNVNPDDPAFGYYETHYSELRNPVYARFMQGLYAVKTNANLVANYALYHIVNNPYDEFDGVGNSRFPYIQNDFVQFYPTWDHEIIPSTSWEASRDGISDARWIATLQNLISTTPGDTADEASAYLTRILEGVSNDFKADYVAKKTDYGFADAILSSITNDTSQPDPAAFDEIRAKVVDYIKRLRDVTITITADKALAVAGSTVEIKVIATNNHDATISKVVVEVPVPEGTEYIAESANQDGALVGLKVQWPEIPELMQNTSKEFIFRVKLK